MLWKVSRFLDLSAVEGEDNDDHTDEELVDDNGFFDDDIIEHIEDSLGERTPLNHRPQDGMFSFPLRL